MPAVDLIQKLLATGNAPDAIISGYPRLTAEDIESARLLTAIHPSALTPPIPYPHPMSACTATNRSGDPCRMPAQHDQQFCFAHDPATDAVRSAIARKGGQASGATRRRVARNRRLRREETLSLFNHSPRCICAVCTLLRLAALES